MTAPAPLPRPPRFFIADDILSGRVSLDGYPFRYIAIGASVASAFGAMSRSGANELIDKNLTAAEFLESRGWEVVSIDQGGTVVFLRRR